MVTSWNNSRYLGSKYIKVFVISHECAIHQTRIFSTTKPLSMVWIFVLFWLECHLLFLYTHRPLVVPQTTPPSLSFESSHSISWFYALLMQDATNIALSFVAFLAQFHMNESYMLLLLHFKNNTNETKCCCGVNLYGQPPTTCGLHCGVSVDCNIWDRI